MLKSVSNSDSLRLLASVADTVNLHFQVFSALKAVNDIAKIMLERVRGLLTYGN